MPRRFLVTGGAGYVGSHLVAACWARGDDVVVLDNLRTGHRAAVLPGVRLVVADLADRAAVDAVLAEGPWDAVFHFASLSLVGESMRLPFRYLVENGMQRHPADRRLRAPRRGAVRAVLDRRAVRHAGGDADPGDAPIDPGSPYGESKWMLERALYWAGRVHGLRSACCAISTPPAPTRPAGSARTTIRRRT